MGKINMDEKPEIKAKGGRPKGSKKSLGGRPALPRADVWAELKKLKFNPVRNLVELAMNEATPAKVKADINMELLSYTAPKCKTTIEVESDNNPLADLLAIMATAGRPLPPSLRDRDEDGIESLH